MESNNRSNNPLMKFFLIFNSFLLLAGASAGSLITRVYFIHGGKRIWLSGWLQTVAFPIILIPLSISYMIRRKTQGSKNAKLVLMKPFLFYCASFIGVIFGGITYMYGYGTSKLPVSTGALICACQLAFTAGFAFIIVKQKFMPFSINCVVLLTVGAVVLALNASTDRPKGETKKDYIMGFLMMGLAAAVEGLVMPLIELAYEKANQSITYTLAMEFDFVLCLFATGFTTIGMLVNNDFKVHSLVFPLLQTLDYLFK
ncbi:hypothetical protein LIER_31232 [Lithospermum erythrorhizon]|uniref:Uncharacterized protein n=1 Tax=Lithospermum erythrorhizon TaxID=34254 RepID=A0AAV3RSL2_LITER